MKEVRRAMKRVCERMKERDDGSMRFDDG